MKLIVKVGDIKFHSDIKSNIARASISSSWQLRSLTNYILTTEFVRKNSFSRTNPSCLKDERDQGAIYLTWFNYIIIFW